MVLNKTLFLLKGYFDTLGKEIELLENGRKASGARSRKLALVMKKEFHEFRKEISETLKAMPVNKRTVNAKEVEKWQVMILLFHQTIKLINLRSMLL